MSRVVIAGGGLVGSLLSLLLKKRNHEVFLFEKRPDPKKNQGPAGRSINLVVTSRGLHGLDRVGLLKEALEMTVPVVGRTMHSIQGELTHQAYGRNKSECNYSISRGELNRFLLSQAEAHGVQVFYDHDFHSLDIPEKMASFSTPQGKKRIPYEVFFGADGAGSQLRQSLKEQSSGSTNPFSFTTEFLPWDYKELTLPLKDGKPALDMEALHIWARTTHMMMALPNQDGSFTMTLYLPREGRSESFSALNSKEKFQHFFQSEFPDAVPLMPKAAEEFFGNPQGTLGTVRSRPWSFNGDVALIGDAAHAIVPFFGQGMNLGFEDCCVLEKFLEETRSGNQDQWALALKKYDEFQRPNANAIADMALENFVEMRDRVADPNFLMRKKIESLLEKNFPELYRSRYGMITYTLIPYALAQEAGRIQDQILAQLSEGLTTADEVDLKKAKGLLEFQLLPFLERNRLSLQRYEIRV